MTARKGSVTLTCDDCGRMVTLGWRAVRTTRRGVRGLGWRTADGRLGVPSSDPRAIDLCPECFERRRAS